jgi:hypothetical protein
MRCPRPAPTLRTAALLAALVVAAATAPRAAQPGPTNGAPERYNRLVATVLSVDLTTKARTDSRVNVMVME